MFLWGELLEVLNVFVDVFPFTTIGFQIKPTHFTTKNSVANIFSTITLCRMFEQPVAFPFKSGMQYLVVHHLYIQYDPSAVHRLCSHQTFQTIHALPIVELVGQTLDMAV